MSYSFNVRARNKDEALKQAGAEFAKVQRSQPIHAADREAALAAAKGVVRLIKHDPARDVSLNVSGSISQNERGETQSVSVNVTASIVDREG